MKNEVPSIEQRLTTLEEWVMHTDQLLADLNETVCSLQDRLDRQDQVIAGLKRHIQKAGDTEEKRMPEDERPPHY